VEAHVTELLEREKLLALLEHARSEGGRLVFVRGEADVGKTSLVCAFRARTDARILAGACENLATPSPLGPFADVAAQAGGGLADALARADARNAARAVLAELDRSTVLEDEHERRAALAGRERRGGDVVRRGTLADGVGEPPGGRLPEVQEGSERPRREQRVAAAAQRRRVPGEVVAEPAEERRLAATGFARDEHGSPVACKRLVVGLMELRENPLALEEPARAGSEGCSHRRIVSRKWSDVQLRRGPSGRRHPVRAALRSQRRAKRRSVEMAIVEADPNLGAQIVADAKEHVLYSWSVQSKIEPIAVAGASGRHFWDYDGKRYLDFASQLVNVSIGHQHPKIIQAIKDQAEQLCTIGPPLASESRSNLGRMLAEVTPGDLSVSFFTNGGAEANENAVKLARLATGRNKIVARYRSYHGATNGAVTLTGDPRRWAVEPGMPGVVRMFDPYTYRCPAGHPDPCPVCTGAPHLEEILQYEGPHTVAAVILETVTGTNGVIPPPEGYLRAIREVCDRHGILLILDEVMAGFGRTGRWFACDHWDVVPDILTVAKGINSGYVPLGAMIARSELVDRIRDQFFPGGLTYAGHPLACASAIASIEAFREEGVVENAAAMGDWFDRELRALAERHPSIGDVRGLGCFWGLELVKNRETREMLVPFNASGEAAAPVARLAKAALDQGLYLMTHWNVVMVVPPLTITTEEAEEGIAILDDVLALADEHYVG
jgi:taurine--2-oxoglutarate transaminase